MKSKIKALVNLIMVLVSLPFYGNYRLFSIFISKRKAFSSMMQWVSLFPGIFGEWLRRGVLQWVTGRSLENCCICFGSLFSDPNIIIEKGVYLGPGCNVGKATLGQNTIIGSGVHITSGLRQHGISDSNIPIRDQEGQFDRVHIGKNCWIGNGAMVCADIGNGSVVGAGSVVVKPIPDYSLVTGNPAQILRSRKTDQSKPFGPLS